MWDYQNPTEDFERRIALDVTPLMLSEEIPQEEKEKVVQCMDEVVKSLLDHYEIRPKEGKLDNRIRKDLKELETDEK